MGKATREAYGEALAELVAENKKIVVLDADLSGSTKTANAKKVAPERFCNTHIEESFRCYFFCICCLSTP